jgi:hypothetical protein
MRLRGNKVKAGFAILITAALVSGATAASAQDISFTYSDPAEGNLVANFTLDVVGGLAVSGSGTVTSSLISGTDDLTLITSSSTLPAGGGSINPTGVPGPSGFTWHSVPGATGPDFLSDAVVNAGAPYLDDYGLSFLISNNSNPIVGGINIYANSSSADSSYTTNLSVGGTCYECYGSGAGTLAPVPLPPADWLFLSGIVGVVALARKRKDSELDAI